MRAYLPSYAMCPARTLDEALEILAEDDGARRPFAGGTDLMVLLASGALRHTRFVSLWGLQVLRTIEVSAAVRIGALTTFTDIIRHPVLREEFPLLGRVARDVGGVANQNRATLGGNIANASPAADSPPVLMVYDAQLELVSARGVRHRPYAGFHTGYKQMDLAADELIAAIHLPRRRGWREHYRKVGARRAQAISKMCFAGAIDVEHGRAKDVRLAFGSVAPTVVRAESAEQLLRGAELTPSVVESAVEALGATLAPIDDVRSTAEYRLRVARNVMRDFLGTAAAGAAGDERRSR